MTNQPQSPDPEEDNFISMPYDPAELDAILKRCCELMLEKKKPEFYITEIQEIFPDKPIGAILQYMQQKDAIKIASVNLGSPGDYNFFSSNEFLNNGGFIKIYDQEQVIIKKQKKIKETEGKKQRKIEELESKIKRSALVSNRINGAIAAFTALALVLAIYQTYHSAELESRLNKLENKIIISDTLDKIRHLTDSNSRH